MPLASVIQPISIQAEVSSADLLLKCRVGFLNPTSVLCSEYKLLKGQKAGVWGGDQKAPCLYLIGPKWASAISFIAPQRIIA